MFSIRDKEFVEGNIKERSLRKIWEDEGSFLWRRSLTKDKLKGACHSCRYGSKCLGGCVNTRLTMNGDIYSENQYCAYYPELKYMEVKYAKESDIHGLFELAQKLLIQEEYQEACYALERVVSLSPKNTEALKVKGYCEYMCGNYKTCEEDNQKALVQNPGDAYAMRGYAIALYRQGHLKDSLNYMRKAVALSGGLDYDLLQDLNIIELNT